MRSPKQTLHKSREADDPLFELNEPFPQAAVLVPERERRDAVKCRQRKGGLVRSVFLNVFPACCCIALNNRERDGNNVGGAQLDTYNILIWRLIGHFSTNKIHDGS